MRFPSVTLFVGCAFLLRSVSAQAEPPKPGTPLPVAKPQDKKTGKKPEHVNHLAEETSPYLLSHKNNPVDWYPWGEAAFARAKRENKPVFLSIGYSACHWCHVMERESFENEAIAAVMNKYFVCIKVDREERPDLDEIYMAAVVRVSGSGGWPMSVWLTPDRKPFWGGTYFPPVDKFGRPGFKRVCETLGKAWADKREAILKDADNMATYLTQRLSPAMASGKLSLACFKIAAANSLSRWDKESGGFAQSPRFVPKFPHASELTALLVHHARSGDKASLRCAEQTLEEMAGGGIYDQIGGGFHRYSTDRRWLVPHFEKMLYDNALLVQTYLDAFLHTGKPLYRRVAVETLDYLIREMQDPKGGFYSTTDADSEGVEGKYFVWTKAEIDELLGEDAALFSLVYGVTEQGNWHELPGVTVLSRWVTEAEAAKQLKIDVDQIPARLAAARKVLFQTRTKRVPPMKDDKVLAAWNGMAITAMARGYQVTGDRRYLEAAQAAAGFVLTGMRQPNGRLFRSWRGGKAKLDAYLADYGFVADGLLHLFESDFDPRWLAGSRELLAIVEKHFRDDRDGSFYFTSDDHETLVARSKSVQESSTPSGTALVIRAFIRAGMLLTDPKLVEVGRRALEANQEFLRRYPNSVVTMLGSVDLLLHQPKEVVVVGELSAPGTQAFLGRLRSEWPANFVVTLVHSGNEQALRAQVPSLEGKTTKDGTPVAYVCEFGACKAPVTAAKDLVLK